MIFNADVVQGFISNPAIFCRRGSCSSSRSSVLHGFIPFGNTPVRTEAPPSDFVQTRKRHKSFGGGFGLSGSGNGSSEIAFGLAAQQSRPFDTCSYTTATADEDYWQSTTDLSGSVASRLNTIGATMNGGGGDANDTDAWRPAQTGFAHFCATAAPQNTPMSTNHHSTSNNSAYKRKMSLSMTDLNPQFAGNVTKKYPVMNGIENLQNIDDIDQLSVSNFNESINNKRSADSGFDFLSSYTSELTRNLSTPLDFDRILQSTQEVFKQRYEKLLLSTIQESSMQECSQILSIFEQGWKHSMLEVVKSCVSKFAQFSLENIFSNCLKTVPAAVLASVFDLKLRASQTPDEEDGGVFYHQMEQSHRAFFCHNCGPTEQGLKCMTCKSDGMKSAVASTVALTAASTSCGAEKLWCVQPGCLATYERQGEIVCLTTPYCRTCAKPRPRNASLQIDSSQRCVCQMECRAEFFESDFLPDSE